MQQMGAGTALMSFLDAISAAKSGQPMQNSQYGEMRFGRRLGTDPSRGTAGGTGVFAFGVPRQGQGGKGNRPFKLGNRSG